MLRAAADLGFTGDGAWLAALKQVSSDFAAPGGQPDVIKQLADDGAPPRLHPASPRQRGPACAAAAALRLW